LDEEEEGEQFLYTRDDDHPFFQGAEARLYDCTFLKRPSILKERFSKKYRHKELDEKLSKERIRAELKAIIKCQDVSYKSLFLFF
jgi:TP53 regulating kinase and related kinases